MPAAEDRDYALVVTPASGAAVPAALAVTLVAGIAVVAVSVALGWRFVGVDRVAPPDVPVPVAAVSSDTPAPVPQRDPVTDAAGRRLRADPSAAALGGEVAWTGAGLRLRVPEGFTVRAAGSELDVRDPARPSAYLVGHVATIPAPATAPMLVAVTRQSAAERVVSGLLEGYEAVRFAGLDGVLTIETRGAGDGAGRMAIWSAYHPAAGGVRNVSVLFGADAATFAALEPTARAVFESARVD